MSLIGQPMPEISGVSKLSWTAGHPVFSIRRMGHNTNWDKFAHFRAPRKAPQYVDMGDFVWVTGGVDGKKNEPSMIYHS